MDAIRSRTRELMLIATEAEPVMALPLFIAATSIQPAANSRSVDLSDERGLRTTVLTAFMINPKCLMTRAMEAMMISASRTPAAMSHFFYFYPR